MKLDNEPRIAPGPGLFQTVIDWMRRAAVVVNPLVDASATQGAQIDANTAAIASTAADVAAMTGPAFYAYLSADQVIASATLTYLHCDQIEFNVASCYDAGAWSFTPDVEGYYLIEAGFCFSPTSGNATDVRMQIWKNGASVAQPVLMQYGGGLGPIGQANGSRLIYMNGTTDVVQVVGRITGTTPRFLAGAPLTFFSGHLARRA